MNVAFVTPFYNGQCEGRFGRFHDWIHELRSMDAPPFNFDVVALTASNPDSTLSSQPPGYLGDASDLWGTRANNAEFLLNLRRVRRDLRRGDYDIVHILRLDSILYPITISAIDDETPVVLGPNIGGWSPIRDGGRWEQDSTTGRLKQQLNFRFRRLLASKARYDVVLAFSEYHGQILSEVGVEPEDIETLHPGVDSAFSPGEGDVGAPLTLLYVGDLTQHKGYDIFLRALAELQSDATALVAGRGSPDTTLVRSLGLTDAVTHLGFVERRALPQYYRTADLYVTPSIDEMGPNTQVESLACGTPVVSTDSPGLNEYPPTDAAVFFSPRTSRALARALRTAEENIDDLTRSAREHAPRFRAANTVEHLQQLYEGVLENTGSVTVPR